MSDKQMTMKDALDNIEVMANANKFTPDMLIGLFNVGLHQVNFINSLNDFERMAISNESKNESVKEGK